MSSDWISSPIHCNGEVVCASMIATEPLLPRRAQIAFKAQLLYNAWQASACDGRQMSVDDFERMDEFETRLSDAALDEPAIRKVVDDFGNFLPWYVAKGCEEVPERALRWTQENANWATSQKQD